MTTATMDDETDQVETIRDDLGAELDRLSLEQAIIDFEVANGRVRDLTQRLIAANQEVADMRGQLGHYKRLYEEERTESSRMKESKTWRLASTMVGFRRLLRGGR